MERMATRMATDILASRVSDPLVGRILRIGGYADIARAQSDAERVRELAADAVDAGLDPDEALTAALSAVVVGHEPEGGGDA